MPRQTLEYYHQLFAQRGIDPSQYSGANGQFLPLLPNLLGRPLAHDEMDYNLELLDEVVRNYRVMNSNGGTTTLGAGDVNKYLKFANVNGEYVWIMDPGSGGSGSIDFIVDSNNTTTVASASTVDLVSGANITITLSETPAGTAQYTIESTGGGGSGDKGDKGDPGAAGDKGETGTTGDKGDKGAAGDKGDKGEASTVPGPQGDKGDVGAKGDAGTSGTSGAKGEPGALGGAVAYSEIHDAFVTPSTLNLTTSFTGWNTGGFGETNNVTHTSGSGPDPDQFEIIETGVYQFVGSFAIQSSVNNSEITAAIFINGVEDTDTTTTRSFGSNNTSGSFTITDLLDLTAGDVVDIRFKSDQALTMTIINISANIVKNSGIGDKGEPGSGSNIETLDEGVSLTTGTTSYNFVGSGVTATKDPVTDAITVTIPDSTITHQSSVLSVESGFSIAPTTTWSSGFDIKIDDSVLFNNIPANGTPGAYSGFVANAGGWYLFEFSISSSGANAPDVYAQVDVNGALYRYHQLFDPNGTSHTMSTAYHEYLELVGGDIITFKIVNDDNTNQAPIEMVSFQLSQLKYPFGA